MGRNPSISLGDHFEDFINQDIKSGHYSFVNEFVRSALRLLENGEKKLKDLRNAIISGEESGFVDDFNSKEHANRYYSLIIDEIEFLRSNY